MSTKDVIAANLRTLRKVRGWSQPELAGKVGISPRTIARLEAAQVADPSINHVRDLARVLGVTVDLLSETALEPLTIAVPAGLKTVLDTPEGMALLSELLDHEQVRGKQAVEAAMRQLERER
ncbi:MAG TPA: helix-turn-helix transcriptional regulator [Polyangiales bacterium]|nr:helix-turn-helix transcriptional regulator [Polyangiales bacterium]